MELVFAGQAQLEREQNARQTRQKSIARLEQGYWVFRAPVGYKYEQAKGGGKNLVIDEQLGPIVREALEGFATGRFASQTEIRRFLEANPWYPKDTPSGEIRPQTIVRLLNKELYAGMLCCPVWGVSLREAQHEPLISKHTYNKIQQRLKQGVYAATRKDLSKDFPLRGAVSCSCCATPLTAGWSTGKTKKVPYYRCRNRDCEKYGKGIRRDKIEGEFKELLSNVAPTSVVVQVFTQMFKDLWEQQVHSVATTMETVRKEIDEVEKMIVGLVDKIAEVSNPRVVTSLENRINVLEKRKLVLSEKAAREAPNQHSYRELFELSMRFLSNPCKLWDSGRYDMRRLVLKLVFPGHLTYCRDEGFLNSEMSLPFNALGDFLPQKAKWCCKRELNSRPLPYQGSALPLSYCSPEDIVTKNEALAIAQVTRQGKT